MLTFNIMKNMNEKIPNPKEIEKEISEFLTKKFGDNVKVISPSSLPQQLASEDSAEHKSKTREIDFDLKPKDLVDYLDQYIIKQDQAKAILSTKICTHFNRIKMLRKFSEHRNEMVGSIKNNVLMIGPTGVGKTYMIRLIAKKLGVPFVKGDATKFSETGYVGGDVEDLVRDLVREADGDIELAQNGIIYVDEIDKIASSHGLVGADVSRTGVQRALLKPMEETDVELKVPHDPISMFQEIERFRKTGKRESRSVNTKNILFIMSGAFSELNEIIKKRIVDKGIGFGATIVGGSEKEDILKHVRSEDLIKYGFESEFVGRLPVRAVFERLTEKDMFDILISPNNPIILGKKLDFAAYGIEIKFDREALRLLAKEGYDEDTGARGLVSAIERALMEFEKMLPSSLHKIFPVTEATIKNPEKIQNAILSSDGMHRLDEDFQRLAHEEKALVKDYVQKNDQRFADKYGLTLTPSRIEMVANFYSKHIMDVGNAIRNIKHYYDEIKKIELYFFKNHDINIVLEEDAIDFIIEQFSTCSVGIEDFFEQLSKDFELGLKLVRDKSGKNRFFITKKALLDPENYLGELVKSELRMNI
jgi:endopeptidase Clp ATP-binding regulatory subunit ClpX